MIERTRNGDGRRADEIDDRAAPQRNGAAEKQISATRTRARATTLNRPSTAAHARALANARHHRHDRDETAAITQTDRQKMSRTRAPDQRQLETTSTAHGIKRRMTDRARQARAYTRARVHSLARSLARLLTSMLKRPPVRIRSPARHGLRIITTASRRCHRRQLFFANIHKAASLQSAYQRPIICERASERVRAAPKFKWRRRASFVSTRSRALCAPETIHERSQVQPTPIAANFAPIRRRRRRR